MEIYGRQDPILIDPAGSWRSKKYEM